MILKVNDWTPKVNDWISKGLIKERANRRFVLPQHLRRLYQSTQADLDQGLSAETASALRASIKRASRVPSAARIRS